MSTKKLIETFHLQQEVDNFVKARVKEKLGKGKYTFHFTGTNHSNVCNVRGPHIPHVRSYYTTVRYGQLENFCLGEEGIIDTPEGKKYIHIVVEKSSRGSAESPGYAKGYYFFTDVEEKNEA